jgi:hypothetical protein
MRDPCLSQEPSPIIKKAKVTGVKSESKYFSEGNILYRFPSITLYQFWYKVVK